MLLVTRQGAAESVCERFARWDLEAIVVGRVTDDGRMKVRWHGETVVDIPVDPVAENAPCYERPTRVPAELGERQKLDLAAIEPETDPQAAFERLLDAPNLASKAWIWRQYDSLVQGNTVSGPGGDAALVRVKREDGTPTGTALAMAVDCNPRWCWLDPRAGTIAAVAESARNVACTGARPLALTNCLNFGNPEKPEIMWEFAESVRGLGDAARALGTPVISGNVSFYNETRGQAIFPTPTIAVVGLLDDVRRHAVSHWTAPGLAIVLLGETREEIGGSEWLALRRGIEAGPPPTVDLAHEQRLHGLLASGVAAGEIVTAHDVADGGLALALAECCWTGPARIGAHVTLEPSVRLEALLFGESTGRVVVATADAAALQTRAAAAGVPAQTIGETGGDRLVIGARSGAPWIDAELGRLTAIWERAIPRRLERHEGDAPDEEAS
jgi:phosphoribosylformylglycinamidine synthase